MILNANNLKLFGMQNLMLENDLSKLEETGIELQHKQTLDKNQVVDKELFEKDIRISAEKMANFYVLYYCLENTTRRLISERLKEKFGAKWWENKVPDDIKDNVKKLQEKEKDSPMSIRSEDALTYTNLGDLIKIIEFNWEHFSDTIRSQRAMKKVLSQFNNLRGVIAHSCELNDDEIKRFELTINDWIRIQT
jgi:Swt1-like HEPN